MSPDPAWDSDSGSDLDSGMGMVWAKVTEMAKGREQAWATEQPPESGSEPAWETRSAEQTCSRLGGSCFLHSLV